MVGRGSPGDARPRRELAAVLLAGAAGAGLVLLATRQVLARVIVLAPAPLPATSTALTAQGLRPAVGALAVAALASLAAVLATRRLLRRLTGLVTAALGAGVGMLAAGPVSVAQAVAAAGRASASPASGSAAGTAAGSVTAGGAAGSATGTGAAGSLGGFPVQVLLGGAGWRVMMIVGALMIIGAGIVVMALANRLPVMSGRYDRSARAQPPQAPAPGAWRARSAAKNGRPAKVRTGAAMWESLSAGEDPTDWPE